MSDISKEELNAFTEAHKQVATSLAVIAGQLETIVNKQDKVLDKFSNGFTKDLSEVKSVVAEIKATSLSISKDTNLMRWASAILVTAIIGFEIFAKFFYHTATVGK